MQKAYRFSGRRSDGVHQSLIWQGTPISGKGNACADLEEKEGLRGFLK
jgi:hypothetical protein